MIRRLVGSEWFLIAQDDHARLAGMLAVHVGNQLFDAPDDRKSFAEVVASHDRGWTELDSTPVRNENGEPEDLFESSVTRGLRAWSGSSEHAMSVGPLAGLLVSLHSLSLSIQLGDTPHASTELTDPATRFALNKFQHRQIELQEICRRSLELGDNVSLLHGLAVDSADPGEQRIVHQFRMLQAMDKVSLALCCTKPPTTQIKPVTARFGGRSVTLRVRRSGDRVRLTPWPFDVARIAVVVPSVRLKVQQFDSDTALRDAIAAAPREMLELHVLASR